MHECIVCKLLPETCLFCLKFASNHWKWRWNWVRATISQGFCFRNLIPKGPKSLKKNNWKFEQVSTMSTSIAIFWNFLGRCGNVLILWWYNFFSPVLYADLKHRISNSCTWGYKSVLTATKIGSAPRAWPYGAPRG
jgi:hypothetical protein